MVGEQCVINDDGGVVVGQDEIKEARREHYNCLLEKEFDWERRRLESMEPVIATYWGRISKQSYQAAENEQSSRYRCGKYWDVESSIGVGLVINLMQ